MNKKVLKTLEFDKILEKTAGFATAESVKQQILNLTPSDDLYEVNERLNETDEALKSLLKYATPPACPVKEQEASIKRALNGGVLSMSELLSISKMIKCGRMYHDYGEGLAEFPCLSGYIRDIFVYNTLENDINSAILNEDEMADNASADLLSIRRTMKQLNNKIRDTLNGLISSGNYSKYLQEAIITTRSGRYVVPVKAEHKGSVPGLVHDTSSTGATIFVEPMAVVEANNKLKQEETKEKYEIERILQQFSAKIAECGEDLLVNIKMLEHLDFAFAKAKLSLDMFGVMPKINNDGIINIKKARHPLIPKEKVVPIDIELGKNFDTLVITGPNTGGKTVSLKTFGLLCLMMQSGLHIPASDNPEMCMFKEIFADIGDEQSIEQSLSTFSSHMVTIVDIVEKSGENSLVLFDELGAGTDPTEGAALAMAVLEYVREKGAKTVATTHYSELKLYAMTTDRVENASCEFNVETLRPTYRLNIGIPGKSNAFAISKKLGLKEDILERAENYLSSENIRFEDVLSSLEQNRIKIEEEHSEAERLSKEALEQEQKLKKEAEKLEKEKENIRREAQRQAQKIIDDATEKVENMLSEIAKLQAERKEKEAQATLQKIRKELKSTSDELDKKLQKKKQVPGNIPKKLIQGTEVYVVETDTLGTVLSPPDKKGMVLVQTGILKITVPVSSLRESNQNEGKKIAEQYTATRRIAGKTQVISPELDIRGKYAEEGVSELERFIDDAVVANLKTVTVVHGKGTGALRQAVHDFLKLNPYVEEFRIGKYGEGDMGVTVIHLK